MEPSFIITKPFEKLQSNGETMFPFFPRKSNKEVKNQWAFGRQRSKRCQVQRLGQIRALSFSQWVVEKFRNNRLGVSGKMKWAAGDRRGSVCQCQGSVGEWLVFCSMDGLGSRCCTQDCTTGKWQWRESSLLQGWVSIFMNGASHLWNVNMT